MVLASSLAQATTTWTQPGTYYSLLTESTGTGSAPSAATDGLSLVGVTTVSVYAETTASTFTAGSLLCYLYDPIGAVWLRAPDLDLTVGAYNTAFIGINIKANGGRIAYIPSGLGQANVVRVFGWKL
jgi:hypothetical protein